MRAGSPRSGVAASQAAAPLSACVCPIMSGSWTAHPDAPLSGGVSARPDCNPISLFTAPRHAEEPPLTRRPRASAHGDVAPGVAALARAIRGVQPLGHDARKILLFGGSPDRAAVAGVPRRGLPARA